MVVTNGADVLPDEARAVLAIASVPHILDIVCRTTGAGYAAVARFSEHGWAAAAVCDRLRLGPEAGDRLEMQAAICADAAAGMREITIDDLRDEERWRDDPVLKAHGLRCYASIPIFRRDGVFFGALCVLDRSPRILGEPGALGMLRGFAELIGHQLDDGVPLTGSGPRHRAERVGSRRREEFVAVLGHDLRSPIASISSGLRLLEREGLDERAARTVRLMQATTGRMNALVDNLLDLARGRLGQGMGFEIEPCDDLRSEIEQVVGEIRAATGHEVTFDWRVEGPVRCDRQRMGRLASNLITNAVKHGDPVAPVRVDCLRDDGGFRLVVENRGEPIPPAIADSLFRPFFRGDGEGRQGLGLGLYIAREIARAHGGTLTLDSAGERTRFTLAIPG